MSFEELTLALDTWQAGEEKKRERWRKSLKWLTSAGRVSRDWLSKLAVDLVQSEKEVLPETFLRDAIDLCRLIGGLTEIALEKVTFLGGPVDRALIVEAMQAFPGAKAKLFAPLSRTVEAERFREQHR